jgi:hypothetical protein
MERPPTKNTPKANTDQDSFAWNHDAHELGVEYRAAHKDDEPRLKPTDLKVLAEKMFTLDAGGSFGFKRLQEKLKAIPGPNPTFSQSDKDAINETLNGVMGTTGRQASHAQMIMLWHALIDQADLKLLSPDPQDAMGW